MPYKLSYLPSARQDIFEIVRYIGITLQNPDAAWRLAGRFTAAVESVLFMPYAHPVHMSLRPLRHEYRKLLVGHYMIFYWVDEKAKTVVVSRVIYGKRNISRMLD